MQSDDGFIAFHEVTKRFTDQRGGSIEVVEPLSLRVARGEFVVFVGPSGCGKTTVMRMVGGLETSSEGAITLAGREITGPSREKGMVFQSYSSFPWLTVLGNVRFGLRYRHDVMAAEKDRIARHYLDAWHRDELLLVGYSLGAETLPFMVSRLPADLRSQIRVVALIGAARTTSFEFHVGDWLGTAKGNVPTAGEIARLRGLNLLCLYGSDEDDSVCPRLAPGLARSVELPGGHHLGGAYRQLAERILLSAGP